MATAEFSKFAGILSAALSQHHLSVDKVRSLDLTTTEKAMATHSSTLAWKIPWTEEPGRLLSMGSEDPGLLSRPCRKRRPSAREDGGVSGVSSQILKDDAVKVLRSTCQQIWKTQQ